MVQEEFDDPQLKQAVQRHWPQPPAGQATRAQIAGLFATDRAEAVSALRRSWFRPVAIAASILILLGGAGFVGHLLYEAHEYHEYVTANMDRFNDMARLHAESTPTDHTAPPDIAATANALGSRVATLPEEAGWTQRAINIQPFYGHSAARVEFSNKEDPAQRVSVFSFPAAALVDAHDGFAYTIDISGQTLAGAVRGEDVFCIVSDRSVDRKTVNSLTQQLVITPP